MQGEVEEDPVQDQCYRAFVRPGDCSVLKEDNK